MTPAVAAAIAQRHALHRLAEVSNREKLTAEYVLNFLKGCQPTQLLSRVGGYGIVAIFGEDLSGPATLLRAELDALPIPETTGVPYPSDHPDVSHHCGHDGHMAILCGLAQYLHEHPVRNGRVLLLFQPAEETGEGCRRVIDDKKFQALGTVSGFALHNVPGYERGEVLIRKKQIAAASSGMVIRLEGVTAHAAEPHHGNSPTRAVAHLLSALPGTPHHHSSLYESAQVTIIHARIGQVSFGTSPGDAEIMLTVRAESDELLDQVLKDCVKLSKATAQMYSLKCKVSTIERFPASVNTDAEVDRVVQAATRAGLKVNKIEYPFAWSEDFGHLLNYTTGALFGIGAGVDQPALHHPEYDFPDELIEPGMKIWTELLKDQHY